MYIQMNERSLLECVTITCVVLCYGHQVAVSKGSGRQYVASSAGSRGQRCTKDTTRNHTPYTYNVHCVLGTILIEHSHPTSNTLSHIML